MAAQLEVETCFGVPTTKVAMDRATQQWVQLRRLIEGKQWSGMRLRAQTQAFIETHKPIWRSDAPPWVVADFMGIESQIKLIPLTKSTEAPTGSDIYIIDGKTFWRIRDGLKLPFEQPKKRVLCVTERDGKDFYSQIPEDEIPTGWEKVVESKYGNDKPASEETKKAIAEFFGHHNLDSEERLGAVTTNEL